MPSILKSFSFALLTLLATGTTALADPVADDVASARGINSANALLRAGKIDQAIEGYRQVPPTDSNRDELNYNLAVAHFRNGDIKPAKALFTEVAAGRDTSVASRSRYNLGNCYYSEALQQTEQDQVAAILSLREAISHYRGALRGNPNHVDARANIELAVELLRKLEQQQEQQQQQQQQQQEQQEQQQSDQSDPQKPNQQQSGQSQEEQSDSQPSESQPSESQPSDGGQSQPDESKAQPTETEDSSTSQQATADEPQQPPTGQTASDKPATRQSAQEQQSPGGQGESSDGEDGDANQEVPAGELTAADQQDADSKPARQIGIPADAQQGVMSQEEALKMLQAVRDRDMLRRIRREQLERSRRVRVERDW